MAGKTQQLRNEITALFDHILETEHSNILSATRLLCNAIVDGRKIHLLGCGAHSQLAVEEVLWRAGGLACWNPILDPGTSLVNGAKRSVSFERMEGYGAAVLNAYGVGNTKDEILLIIDAYGIAPMSIDVVLECRKRKVMTIGVTSPAYGLELPANSTVRHSSGKNLFEEVDLFLNTHVPFGDTAVPIDGFAQRVGSLSTFCSDFMMNALVCEIVEELVHRGVTPPVFMSANIPGGDDSNAEWERQYSGLARYML